MASRRLSFTDHLRTSAAVRLLLDTLLAAELEIQRADALAWAPAAFRQHCVYLSAIDPGAA